MKSAGCESLLHPVELCSTDRRGWLSLRLDRGALSELYYLVQYAVGYFPFRGFGNLDHFAVRDDRDRVAVGIETNALARDVVYHDCIERFRGQLFSRVFEDVFRLGGEAYDELPGLSTGDLGENIRRR